MVLAGQIFNVFSGEEIQSITVLLEKLPNASNQGEFHAYANGIKPKDFLYPALYNTVIKKLEVIFKKKLILDHAMYLKEFKPWGIHTDYVKGDINPDMAILVPLNLEELDTSTVVFNEECRDNFSTFILNNSKLENNAKNLYNTLCGHQPVDQLEYVSLQGAYKWIPGSIIYWNRKLLHSSDNFVKNGIKQKTALVLFTTNDE